MTGRGGAWGRGGWHGSAGGTLVVRGVGGVAGVIVGVSGQVRLQLSRPEEGKHTDHSQALLSL